MSKEMRDLIDKVNVKNWEQFLITNLQLSENTEVLLYETKLSRIWQHIENSVSFGVISPYRKNFTLTENLERYKELKNIVRNTLNLGFIELEGGFFEEGDWVNEKSLFIPKITKKDLLDLGVRFDQYSVIYKDDNEFVEIGANQFSGIGKVITNFIKSGWGDNLQINSELTQQFFSKLAKGGHRDSKFLFNVKESYLFEVDEKSFNEIYRESKGNKQKRYIKLL
jgi:hypothetical protein